MDFVGVSGIGSINHTAMEEIPTTMFAWRKHKGNDKPVWEEIPVPKPSETQVLVKLLAAGGV